LQTFEETIEIGADPQRVWRALTLPAEVVCWDTGVVAPLDAPADYPRVGQHVRWRYRFGPLRLTLHDRPSEVEPDSVLRSLIRLGPFDFDETYTLRGSATSTTQLTAAMSVVCRIPVLAPLLERLVGRSLARSTVRSSLAAIKLHCERPE